MFSAVAALLVITGVSLSADAATEPPSAGNVPPTVESLAGDLDGGVRVPRRVRSPPRPDCSWRWAQTARSPSTTGGYIDTNPFVAGSCTQLVDEDRRPQRRGRRLHRRTGLPTRADVGRNAADRVHRNRRQRVRRRRRHRMDADPSLPQLGGGKQPSPPPAPSESNPLADARRFAWVAIWLREGQQPAAPPQWRTHLRDRRLRPPGSSNPTPPATWDLEDAPSR